MSLSPFRRGLCRAVPVVALLTTAALAAAQSPATPARADPLDAQARVPAISHASSLAGYRRLGDDQRTDWKAANETVNRIGGWRAYTREAQQPDPAPARPAAPAVPTGAAAPTSPTASAAQGGHTRH